MHGRWELFLLYELGVRNLGMVQKQEYVLYKFG